MAINRCMDLCYSIEYQQECYHSLTPRAMCDMYTGLGCIRAMYDMYTGLGCITWSPMACGALTGKYEDGVPPQSRAALKVSWRLQVELCLK